MSVSPFFSRRSCEENRVPLYSLSLPYSVYVHQHANENESSVCKCASKSSLGAKPIVSGVSLLEAKSGNIISETKSKRLCKPHEASKRLRPLTIGWVLKRLR